MRLIQRILFYPFAQVYGFILWIRSCLFQTGAKKRHLIQNKSICIGNINVGGTGKSPLAILIAQHFKEKKPVLLSRGYGRKTKGLLEANTSSVSTDIGDEPLQFYSHFEFSNPVIVAEKRKLGAEYIQKKYPDSLIILDDAFQHLAVKASCYILCTRFDNLFCDQLPFPSGDLREFASSAKRSDIIVVTKCPSHSTHLMKQQIVNRLSKFQKPVFFSSVNYSNLKGTKGEKWKGVDTIILVTGIASNQDLIDHLSKNVKVLPVRFEDHHNFTTADVRLISEKIAIFDSDNVAVVTTQKDYMRLKNLTEFELTVPCYVQEITIEIDEKNAFFELLKQMIS